MSSSTSARYGGGEEGSTVSLLSILFIPTSRGSVRLATTDINDFPLVDPNYSDTEVDKYVHRQAARLQYYFAGSNATVLSRDILNGEVVPAGQPALSSDMTDETLDSRLQAVVSSAFHPHGTASMGTVVDTSLRVIGVNNLPIVDTSVFPVAISAHLQVATYALAEQAAVIITQERQEGTKV